jgi:hypothetical protein
LSTLLLSAVLTWIVSAPSDFAPARGDVTTSSDRVDVLPADEIPADVIPADATPAEVIPEPQLVRNSRHDSIVRHAASVDADGVDRVSRDAAQKPRAS